MFASDLMKINKRFLVFCVLSQWLFTSLTYLIDKGFPSYR